MADQNVVGYLPGSGDTLGVVSEFYSPHPVWTEGEDPTQTVTQGNAITLGGFNGLNN